MVPIRWIRTQDPPQVEVRDGACVIYLPQTSSGRALDRLAAEPLVEQCIAKGGLRPGAGDFDLYWYEVDELSELWRRRDSVYPRSPRQPSLSLKPSISERSVSEGVRMYGFFSRPGVTTGPCYVVSLRNRPKALGHELKHCYEGFWHD